MTFFTGNIQMKHLPRVFLGFMVAMFLTLPSSVCLAKGQIHPRGVYGIVQLGVCFGGDRLVELHYQNGSEQKIRAGQLFSAKAGIVLPTIPGSTHFETQLDAGWKFDNADAANGRVTFSRFPVELIQYYRLNALRFGAGITYHIHPEIDGSGFADDFETDFKNALGVILEVDYFFSYYCYAGAQYTFIEYEVKNYYQRFSGDSLGFLIGFRF